MNKLLNDALRAKGYAGPDIKMVLTDVTDPNGPFYTDTLTNVVVFDRKQLANLDRDKILNILGHEFGHYSKEDNKTGTQTIANYTGAKLEDRTKAMVAKEATEDTLAAIRNNPNVITGEEGRLLAESIPMDRREYDAYIYERDLNLNFTIPLIKKDINVAKGVIEEVTENDLKKLVDDTPTIKLADNVAKESTGLKETVKVGENFGKLGIYVGDEHPELKINWAATNNKRGSHALERLTERNISKLDVEYYVENGKVLKQSGRNYAFVTEKGMAILSDDGVLITSYSSEYYDETMKEAVRRLFGK